MLISVNAAEITKQKQVEKNRKKELTNLNCQYFSGTHFNTKDLYVNLLLIINIIQEKMPIILDALNIIDGLSISKKNFSNEFEFELNEYIQYINTDMLFLSNEKKALLLQNFQTVIEKIISISDQVPEKLNLRQEIGSIFLIKKEIKPINDFISHISIKEQTEELKRLMFNEDLNNFRKDLIQFAPSFNTALFNNIYTHPKIAQYQKEIMRLLIKIQQQKDDYDLYQYDVEKKKIIFNPETEQNKIKALIKTDQSLMLLKSTKEKKENKLKLRREEKENKFMVMPLDDTEKNEDLRLFKANLKMFDQYIDQMSTLSKEITKFFKKEKQKTKDLQKIQKIEQYENLAQQFFDEFFEDYNSLYEHIKYEYMLIETNQIKNQKPNYHILKEKALLKFQIKYGLTDHPLWLYRYNEK